jgi:hypothetical protein
LGVGVVIGGWLWVAKERRGGGVARDDARGKQRRVWGSGAVVPYDVTRTPGVGNWRPVPRQSERRRVGAMLVIVFFWSDRGRGFEGWKP